MLGGYDSSDDEINAADHAADAFGINRIEPSTKRTRVDGDSEVLMPQAPEAAPDVLAEVLPNPLLLPANLLLYIGSISTDLPRPPPD